MSLITTTDALAAICDRMAKHPFITVDTEFLRETTYYPLLCVAQIASADEAAVIDAEQGIVVVSEPLDKNPGNWIPVPESHVLVAKAGEPTRIVPFLYQHREAAE